MRVRDAIQDLPDGFDRGEELYIGADGTPTSGIDKVAEDAILRAVDELDLEANVLSEECGLMDRGYEDTLVIDPIDGTHNAVMGVPFYSVSLALGKDTLLGVRDALVLNLVNGDLFHAEKGKGATLNGCELRVRSNAGPPAMVFYMGRCVHPRTFELVKRASRVRAMGCASLEMCLVARGHFDGYYFNAEFHANCIRVVDIAASSLVLREAGGELVDLRGDRLDMPFDLAARSNFLAYGDERTKEILL